MSRNRNRKRSNMPGSVFPATTAIVLLLVGALSLAYLWLDGRCHELGQRIHELEREADKLQRKVAIEEYRWATMTSPVNMQKLIESHGLTMTWPAERNIIRLRRDGVESVAAQPRSGTGKDRAS